MDNSKIYIITFIITAIWDIILRFLSLNYDKLPIFMKYNFIKYLQPYFKKHTLIVAALIAGFIGATCQFIILNIHKLPTNKKTLFSFMLVTFMVGVFYGFIMRWSNLFFIFRRNLL